MHLWFHNEEHDGNYLVATRQLHYYRIFPDKHSCRMRWGSLWYAHAVNITLHVLDDSTLHQDEPDAWTEVIMSLPCLKIGIASSYGPWLHQSKSCFIYESYLPDTRIRRCILIFIVAISIQRMTFLWLECHQYFQSIAMVDQTTIQLNSCISSIGPCMSISFKLDLIITQTAPGGS